MEVTLSTDIDYIRPRRFLVVASRHWFFTTRCEIKANGPYTFVQLQMIPHDKGFQ